MRLLDHVAQKATDSSKFHLWNLQLPSRTKLLKTDHVVLGPLINCLFSFWALTGPFFCLTSFYFLLYKLFSLIQNN